MGSDADAGEPTEQTVILAMTDLHYGAENERFDPEVLQKQVDRVGGELARLREELPSVDKLVVWLGGDVNDGEGIFASQPHEQRVSSVEQQASECAQMLLGFLTRQKAVWGEIEIRCSPGNHGRSDRGLKSGHDRTNWDIVTYRYLKLLCSPLGIQVTIDENPPFVTTLTVRGWRVLLHHGHYISAGAMPEAAIFRRLVGWANTERVGGFDVAVMGHWHRVAYVRQNRHRLLMSGSPKIGDRYAFQKMGLDGIASWLVFGVTAASPVAWLREIELDPRRWARGHVPTPRPVAGASPSPQSPEAPPVFVDAPSAGLVRTVVCSGCRKPFRPLNSTQRWCEACRTQTCTCGCGETWVDSRHVTRRSRRFRNPDHLERFMSR